MEIVYNWTAKRAGGSVTVYGKTVGGEFRRITGVEQITVEMREGLPAVVAMDKHHRLYKLATREMV